MKRIFIVITILVLTLAAAIALGVDHNRTALAQAPQPPDVDNRGGSGGSTTTPQWIDNLPAGESTDGGEIQVTPYRQMSYQGKLEIDGSPCTGSKNITFRLYTEASGPIGDAMWTETQAVSCDNGLFSVMLGAVTPLPYAVNYQSQLWLGVQPAGSASELTPRQMLGTVGYAMNLMGGATMVDTNPVGTYSYSLWVHSYENKGIYASSDITDGVGVYGYATGPYGGGSFDPTGVWGKAGNGIGVRGTADYIGVRGDGYIGVYGVADDQYSIGVYGYGAYTGTFGVYGASAGPYGYGVFGYGGGLNSPGVYGSAGGNDDGCSNGDSFCNAGAVSQAWANSYGNFSYSSPDSRAAYLGFSENIGFYTGYFYNTNGGAGSGLGVWGDTYLDGDLTVTGSKTGYVADIAINAGSEPLERGDVVVVVGMEAPILGEIPVMRVQKATAETASGIVGVVDVLWEACTKSAEELQPGEVCGRYNHEVTTIQPGQYVGVVTLGAFQWLKVDASTPIKAGDLLSISPTAGVAAKAQQITIDGYSFYAPGTIIGKALQDLESGTGTIAVFVSLK
jgi:hypothetical protein